MEQIIKGFDSKMNWYKPYTYIGKLDNPNDPNKDLYYVGIMLPLPTGYSINQLSQENFFVIEKNDADRPHKITKVSVKLLVIHADQNGYHANQDFLWTDEFILEGIDAETEIEVLVEKHPLTFMLPYRDQPQARNIKYFDLLTQKWGLGYTEPLTFPSLEEEGEEASEEENNHSENEEGSENQEKHTEEDANESSENEFQEIEGESSRGISGNGGSKDPKKKKLGKGTPTKGASADKMSVKFIKK